MQRWMLFVSGAALGTLCGCGHNPNHGINRAQALAAARRIHPALPPNFKGAIRTIKGGAMHFRGPHGEQYFLMRGPRPAGGPAGSLRLPDH